METPAATRILVEWRDATQPTSAYHTPLVSDAVLIDTNKPCDEAQKLLEASAESRSGAVTLIRTAPNMLLIVCDTRHTLCPSMKYGSIIRDTLSNS